MHLPTLDGSGEFNTAENGKFEIGGEELENEDTGPSSTASDWEDGEPDEDGGGCPTLFWDDNDGELSGFVSAFYDALFQGSSRIDDALKRALASHRSLRYSCHLPSVT